MGPYRLVGLTPVQTGAQDGRAAYEDAALHPRVSRTGRYAMPERPYRYGASPIRLRPVIHSGVSRNR